MPSNDVLINRDDNPHLSRTSKSTLQEQIADIVRRKIESGEYAAGDKLPSVRELARIYNVSRETAKLSLGTLKRNGYIEMIPSRGGYVLDRHDEKESTQKKGSIGFVVDLGDEYQPDMAVNPIYESIMQNIDAQVVNWGNHLLTTYICYRKETGKERFTGLLKKVDGLFITGLINPDLLKELQTLSTPVVSLFSNLDVDTIDEIGLNSEKTYYEIVKRIIDMGHNTIAYLDGPKIYYQKARRISGCTQAVNEHPADGVSFTEICAEGWSSEAARSATEKLLKSKPRIDVIVAVNDILATGALRACQDSGFRVPEDISVVGAKNTILSISSNPQLTTVDYHFGEIAKIAAERMMNRINSKACIPVKIEVIGTLVERQSTKNKRKNTKG